MATKAELEQALIAADKAGDTEGAKRLAQSIINFKDTPNVDAVRAQFDALPTWQKPFKAADDVVRMLANGATLGWADNIAGNLPGGGSTEEQNAATEAAKARGGSASTAAEIMGMLLPASRLSAAAGGATGMTANTIGESMIREGLAGGAGNTIAALSGTTDPNELLASGATGVLGGAAGGALGSLSGKFLNWAGNKLGLKSSAVVDDVVPPRSTQELKAATDKAYERVDRLGTRYDPDDYLTAVQGIDNNLKKARMSARKHPNAAAVFEDDLLGVIPPNNGGIAPRDLDDLRQIIVRDATGTPGDNKMAGIMRQGIDDFLATGKTTTGVTSESADEASRALGTARDLNRRMRTMEDIDSALFKGENATSSRGDVNALRTMLNNPNRTRGMSSSELEALKRVVRGDRIENTINATLGGIPVSPLGAGFIAGAASGNPALGVLATGAAAGSKPGADFLARKYTDANIKRLIDSVSGGSTTPSAARRALPVVGQAVGSYVPEQDRKKKRRRPLELTVRPSDRN